MGIAVFRRDAATGKLTQLDGKDGCLSPDGMSEDGADTCTDARRLSKRCIAITLSRDERIRQTSQRPRRGAPAPVPASSIFSRDATTGKLPNSGAPDGCASVQRLQRGRRRRPARTSAAAATRTRSRSRGTTSTPTCPITTQDSIALLDVDPATGRCRRPGGDGRLPLRERRERGWPGHVPGRRRPGRSLERRDLA